MGINKHVCRICRGVEIEDGDGETKNCFCEVHVDCAERFWALDPNLNEFERAIRLELSLIAEMLSEKNRQYGNSALDPVRVFSKASPLEQLKVRIDDKLSRLKRGTDDQEDTVEDLIGYLVLYRLAHKNLVE